MSTSVTNTTRVASASPMRIAIDCGGVIQGTDNDGPREPGHELNVMAAEDAPSEECIEAIKTIIEQFGCENVFVLSKCRTKMQQQTVIMMGQADMFQRTGLLPENVLFCTERSGGSPPPVESVVELEPPADEGLFAGKAQYFVRGPRVAPGRVGKGAMAASFGLRCLIDDRVECLESFRDGALDSLFGDGSNRPFKLEPPNGLLVLATFFKPNAGGPFTACRNWASVLDELSSLEEASQAVGAVAQEREDSEDIFTRDESPLLKLLTSLLDQCPAKEMLVRLKTNSEQLKSVCAEESDQIELLGTLADGGLRSWHEGSFLKTLMLLYELDVVEEDAIKKWQKASGKEGALAKEAQAMVTWLEEAEEESD